MEPLVYYWAGFLIESLHMVTSGFLYSDMGNLSRKMLENWGEPRIRDQNIIPFHFRASTSILLVCLGPGFGGVQRAAIFYVAVRMLHNGRMSEHLPMSSLGFLAGGAAAAAGSSVADLLEVLPKKFLIL